MINEIEFSDLETVSVSYLTLSFQCVEFQEVSQTQSSAELLFPFHVRTSFALELPCSHDLQSICAGCPLVMSLCIVNLKRSIKSLLNTPARHIATALSISKYFYFAKHQARAWISIRTLAITSPNASHLPSDRVKILFHRLMNSSLLFHIFIFLHTPLICICQ